MIVHIHALLWLLWITGTIYSAWVCIKRAQTRLRFQKQAFRLGYFFEVVAAVNLFFMISTFYDINWVW